MTAPVTIDIPHKLGKAGARARLESGISQIAGLIPGGSLKTHEWRGDTLHFVVEAMGQRVDAQIDVLEARIHVVIDLPPLVALFADKIKNKFRAIGVKLLR